MTDTTLAQQMIARADQDGLPDDHDLRVKAACFEVTAKGYAADPQTKTPKQLLGAWARAKRSWSNYTGEPLI